MILQSPFSKILFFFFFFLFQKYLSRLCIIAWIIYYWSEFLVFMALKTCTRYTQFTNFMTIIPVVSLEQTLCYRTGSGLSVCGTRSSCGWPETAAPGGRHICSHTTWPRIYIGLSVAAHQKKKRLEIIKILQKRYFLANSLENASPRSITACIWFWQFE